MQYIKFFSELKQDDIALAGGKAASLGEMTRAGLSVPPGFCLTTGAYRAFVNAHDLQEKIVDLAGQIGRDGRKTRTPASTLHTLFTAAPMPEPIMAEIAAAYGQLQQTAVAVRSSATAEDLPGASFAGQQDTFLNIQGTDAVITAVLRCWASLWTARAIAYRQREQIAPDDVAIAVIVQELIPAVSAGVLFTANPVSGVRDETVINAAWGLGEAIVSGLVTPDNIVVNKATGRVKSWQIADKQLMTVRTAEGTSEQAVPKAKRIAPVLNNGQIGGLTELGRAVENHAGRPMDLEWAIADERLYLLQARPITALPPQPEQPDLMGMEWSRLMLIERYPDPITPFTWSVVNEMLFSSFELSFQIMGAKLPQNAPPLIRQIYGRPYINVTLLNQGFASLPIRPPVKSQAKDAPPSRPRPDPRKLPGMLLTLARLANLLRTTHRQWARLRPSFETAVRQEATRPWATLDTAELLTHFSRQESLVAPLLDNHARSIIAAELSLQLLQAITRAWLGDDDKQLAITLLSGLKGNMTVATNRALWRLAALARPHDPLRQVITASSNDEPSDDWREQMAIVPGGPAFLSNLDDFLQTYGHRSPRYEMMHPTWIERPQQILEMVQMYLDETVVDPGEGEARQAAAREKAAAAARQRLSLPKRLIFDRVLPLAQTYFRLRENQQFYLTMGLPILRRILPILGYKLQEEGTLQEVEDVFFLENSELQALAAQLAGLPADGRPVPTNPAQLVAERRAALARYQAMSPPVHWGGDDGVGETATSTEPVLSLSKGSVQAVSANTLRGVPASRGAASGKARIVRGPEDFGKLQPGEILVAPATTPAWTPLFGVAAGLVTDYGGLLSHAGVVAREYGLPAVLGTNIATQTIQNGDEIRVDGDQGVVLLNDCHI